MAAAAQLSCLFVIMMTLVTVQGHATPCNQGDEAMCLDACRLEFIRTDDSYWFGSPYAKSCPNGPDGTFYCMNTNPSQRSIAERLLGSAGVSFNASIIEQTLHIRFNTPAASYMSCSHRFRVQAFESRRDIDHTHVLYYDMFILDHRPSIFFDYQPGEAYTLIAYDAGHQRMGGMWINIVSSDTASGEEVIPHWGPRNALWTQRNVFVYALFRQPNGQRINTASLIKEDILTKSIDQDGHYYLENLISQYNLQGPVGVGYLVVKADAFGILYYKQKNVFNNCPYLVSKNKDVMMALGVMGYELNEDNSFGSEEIDFMGTFLTSLEVDMRVTYISDEVHYDSCCQHYMYKDVEMVVDPLSSTPILPIYTRARPEISLTAMEMQDHLYFHGKLFTLMLLDVTDAAANATRPNTIVHWHVVNVPGNSVDKGEVVRSYLPPIIEGDGTRLFLFLLMKQPSRIDASSVWPHTGFCFEQYKSRCQFDFGTFQKSLNLEIVGLSHFLAIQDAFSRAVLYGAVHPSKVAQSMKEFTSRDGALYGTNPTMTKAQACQGVEGYADPCPSHNACGDDDGHDHDHSGHDHSGHDH